MKKIILALILLVSMVSVNSQENVKPIITVLDFTANEVSESEMKSIISLLSSALFKTDKFTVIDVSQRETVLAEMEFSMGGCSDESCMLEIGKMLSAEAIVVGSIGKVGDQYVFSSKMLETETARTLNTADGIYENLGELLKEIQILANDLCGMPNDEVIQTTAAEPDPPAETEVIETSPEPEKTGSTGKTIAAWATLAGSAGGIGAGTFFLIKALPPLMAFFDSKTAYDTAT